MLLELFEEDFTKLTGCDYSEKSIELAKQIASNKECKCIEYKVVDLLSDSVTSLGTFKICHDKGTFDAIALMEDSAAKKKIYVRNVWNLLEDNGHFIITSCNFCEEELEKSFSDYFIKFEVIPSKTFQFGGKVGKTTTSICFKKKMWENVIE